MLDYQPLHDASVLMESGNYSSYQTGAFDDTNQHFPVYYDDVLLIAKIESSNFSVEFHRRDSGIKAHLLNEIIIKDKNKNTIRSISFNYKEIAHTLLESINIKNANNSKEKTYFFSYYLPQLDMQFYPDQWGYYKIGSITKERMFLHEEFKRVTFLNFFNGGYLNTYTYGQLGVDYARWPYFYNRSSNNNCNYYSLRKVTYPTGGFTEYEPHWDGRNAGGGQRIAKIISNPNDGSSSAITTVFRYGKNESGKTLFNLYINEMMFMNQTISLAACFPINDISQYEDKSFEALVTRIFSSKNLSPIENYFSAMYDQITTYEYSDNHYKGKKVSIFDNLMENVKFDVPQTPWVGFPGAYFTYPYFKDVEEYKLGNKPRLRLQVYYNDTNAPVQATHYTYQKSYPQIEPFIGMKVNRRIYGLEPGNANPIGGRDGVIDNPYQFISSYFDYMKTYVKVGTDLLLTKSDTLYTDQGKVVTAEAYSYNNKNQLIKTAQTDSKGDNIIKEYKYPQNFVSGNNVYGQMVEKNMISPVVEQITTRKGQDIGKIKTEYIIDTNKTKDMILPELIKTSSGSGIEFRIDFTYDQYDIKGNILQYTTLDGISTVYLWSYNYQYPVAEIRNSTYAEISKHINVKVLSEKLQLSDSDIRELDSLRGKLPNASITIYTYKPLVGIASMIDPAGVKTMYNYDNFGRLTETYIEEEGEKRIVNDYRYNYRPNNP